MQYVTTKHIKQRIDSEVIQTSTIKRASRIVLVPQMVC